MPGAGRSGYRPCRTRFSFGISPMVRPLSFGISTISDRNTRSGYRPYGPRFTIGISPIWPQYEPSHAGSARRGGKNRLNPPRRFDSVRTERESWAISRAKPPESRISIGISPIGANFFQGQKHRKGACGHREIGHRSSGYRPCFGSGYRPAKYGISPIDSAFKPMPAKDFSMP